MRIYKVFGQGSYSSGIAIVAADSPKQATQVVLGGDLYGFNDSAMYLTISSVKAIRGASIPRKKPGLLTWHVYIE